MRVFKMECCGVDWPKDWMDYNTLYQGDSFAVAGDSYLMAKVLLSCCAAAADQVIFLTMLIADECIIPGPVYGQSYNYKWCLCARLL